MELGQRPGFNLLSARKDPSWRPVLSLWEGCPRKGPVPHDNVTGCAFPVWPCSLASWDPRQHLFLGWSPASCLGMLSPAQGTVSGTQPERAGTNPHHPRATVVSRRRREAWPLSLRSWAPGTGQNSRPRQGSPSASRIWARTQRIFVQTGTPSEGNVTFPD